MTWAGTSFQVSALNQLRRSRTGVATKNGATMKATAMTALLARLFTCSLFVFALARAEADRDVVGPPGDHHEQEINAETDDHEHPQRAHRQLGLRVEQGVRGIARVDPDGQRLAL